MPGVAAGREGGCHAGTAVRGRAAGRTPRPRQLASGRAVANEQRFPGAQAAWLPLVPALSPRHFSWKARHVLPLPLSCYIRLKYFRYEKKKKKAPEDISVNVGVRNTPLKEESIANAIKASFLHDFPPPSAPTTVPSFPTHVFMTRLHLYVSVCF